jgi:hypothetical protein
MWLSHHREVKARSGAPLWLCAGSTGAFRCCIHPCFYRELGCTSLRIWASWWGLARYLQGWACGMHWRRIGAAVGTSIHLLIACLFSLNSFGMTQEVEFKTNMEASIFR